MKKVNILMVGVGGYGDFYYKSIASNPGKPVEIVGIVDPMASLSRAYNDIVDKAIPVYNSLTEFYANNKADLAVISSPIHLHYPHAMECMQNGSNVLLEKPVCAKSEDARMLIETAKKNAVFIAVGYQLNYSNDVLQMKKDILEGKFGKPKLMKTIIMTPRWKKYYTRNTWAGRITMDDGAVVNDSPVNNACAHNLHLMLYLLGETQTTACIPTEVEAELYRANKNIQNYDTAAIKCKTEKGTEIYYYVSHAVENSILPPICEYIFENAVIYFGGEHGDNFKAVFNDGGIIDYSQIDKGGGDIKKLWDCVGCIINGGTPSCTAETATPHLLIIETLQKIYTGELMQECFVKEDISTGDLRFIIDGIDNIFPQCFEKNALPYDLSAAWAVKSVKTEVARV